MAQLGYVHKVRVRPLRSPKADWRLLGSVDDAGTTLVSAFRTGLKQLRFEVDVPGFEEAQPELLFEREAARSAPDEVGAILTHHRFGDRGALNRSRTGERVPIVPEDNQEVELGVLLRAKRNATTGFLVLHSPNRRGAKHGVEREMRRYLASEYDLYFDMKPVAPMQAVRKALEKQGAGGVTFRRLNTPSGMFDQESEWWNEAEDVGLADLRLEPTRGAKLAARRVVDYFRSVDDELDEGEEPTTFRELATFDDKVFDEVTVDVTIKGRKRKVYIDANGFRTHGAFPWDLDLSDSPTDDEIMSALAEIANP